MAQRAQGDTPRNRSKYRQLTSYRDLVPAPRSHTAPTDATSKLADHGGMLVVADQPATVEPWRWR